MFELISEGWQGFTKQKGRRKIQAMGKECAKALPPGGQDKLVELTRVLGVWSSEGDRERNLRRRLRSNQRLIMQWFVWTSSKKQCIEETEAKYKSFPCDLDGKESACSVGDPGLIPGLGRSPGKWLPTPVELAGEFHGQRSLAGYSPWGRKEPDTTEQLSHSCSFFTVLQGHP